MKRGMKKITIRLTDLQHKDLTEAAAEMTTYMKASGNPFTLERFVVLLIEMGIYSAEKVKDGNIELGIAEAMMAAEQRGCDWAYKHLGKGWTAEEVLEYEREAALMTTARAISQDELDAAGITISITDKVEEHPVSDR